MHKEIVCPNLPPSSTCLQRLPQVKRKRAWHFKAFLCAVLLFGVYLTSLHFWFSYLPLSYGASIAVGVLFALPLLACAVAFWLVYRKYTYQMRILRLVIDTNRAYEKYFYDPATEEKR